MHQWIDGELEKLLGEYAEKNPELVVKAKEEYFSNTGKTNEEDSDYEARLNTFNDWFIFHYKAKDNKTPIEHYVEKADLDTETKASLLNINFAVFSFEKFNLKKQMVLKDILHDKKVILARDHHPLALLEGDLFISRCLTVNDKSYLLRGAIPLPKVVKSNLQKRAKMIRKGKVEQTEYDFLMQVEALKTKSLRYSHVSPTKIFEFN